MLRAAIWFIQSGLGYERTQEKPPGGGFSGLGYERTQEKPPGGGFL
jgi:hypothetical protein